MTVRPIARAALALSALTLISAASAFAAAKPAAKPAPAPPIATPVMKTQVATFAMGCFWCGETQFESQPGVVDVISGYTGGPEQHPTYEQVSNHKTGHYESVQVTFDPTKTTYEKLLDIFWHSVDPTQGDGQFCDIGKQYRAAIFVQDESQRRASLASKARLEASHVLKKPVVTEVVTASRFWPAEDYHQDFWKKDPQRYHSYREGCGRDKRLVALYGKDAAKPLVH